MKAKVIRIPNSEGGFTELTSEKLKELIETSKPGELYTRLKTDAFAIDLILQSEFGKNYQRMRIDYVKSMPNLEATIADIPSPQDFLDQYNIHENILNIALKEKFGGTFVEVRVIGKFKKIGIPQNEIKAAIAASASQQALADQIKETLNNVIQFIRLRFKGANYYEVKHECATANQLIQYYRKLWDEEGYEALPRTFLSKYLGTNWKKKLQEQKAGAKPNEVLVPLLKEIPEMKPEEITSGDLIKLIRDNSINKLQALLNKSNIEETLAYIKSKIGKPYGCIVLDNYSKEELLQKIDESDSTRKFYEGLLLTEAEFSRYIRLRFLTKLSVQNEVVGRTNSQIPIEILIETVRNNGMLKKPKRSIETMDKAELRQKIIDAENIDELVEDLGITVSILHHVIAERFEDETYLEIKLSNEFKSEEDLRARIDKTEKLSDLANELNIGTIPLSLYIKKRLKGETFSQIKFKGLTEERMEELFSKSNTKAKMFNFLKILCGLSREDAVKLLIDRYGEDWETKLKTPGAALKPIEKEAARKRSVTEEETGIQSPEPPAAAKRPHLSCKSTTITTPMWQPFPKEKKDPGSEDDDEKYKNDPVWSDIIDSSFQSQ